MDELLSVYMEYIHRKEYVSVLVGRNLSLCYIHTKSAQVLQCILLKISRRHSTMATPFRSSRITVFFPTGAKLLSSHLHSVGLLSALST